MIVTARAKVNFSLEVFGVRADGYHALRSVVMPVTLADEITLEPALALSSDTGYDDDLCLKAARVLEPTRGAAIRVEKRIPAGGGLGGGSADAAAVLRGLNELWGLLKTPEELSEIGAAVGSDVPSLVLGGPVLMQGRGEKVERLGPFGPLDLVLANPGVPSSTPEVYAACTPRDRIDSLVLGNLLAALASGDVERIAAALSNDLQEPAERLHPEITAARAALAAAGAKGVTMSGSGSTVFGLAASREDAEDIAERVRAKGYAAWAVRTCGAEETA